ncbi:MULTISPECIES: STAS domain-containing protein [unclassified Streptomyces]|uniref:STAS domain-containing protein n=1 Tax=unclassified Streptomyces TaxID=2593676 RepID=UPI00099EEA90|nr:MULTISPECIES: STAS domain-containing protein [unclassified Streptomyces]
MTTIEVDEDEYGSWTVFQVRGEMDLITSPRIRRRVHDAVAGGRRDLVMDLSAVRFCDSSGVGVLIAARRLLRSCGGRLRLILPEDREGHVGRVLAALGVRRLFEVYEDVPAAVSGAGASAALTESGLTASALTASGRTVPSAGT